MDVPVSASNKDPANNDPLEKLMVSGLVHLTQEDSSPFEVSRGMAILTCDGREVGKVAAVIVDSRSQIVTHILLTRLHLSPEYRLVPVNLIKQVSEETISLDVCRQTIESLPVRQAS